MSVPPGALVRLIQLILTWLPVLIELVVRILAIWTAFRAAKEAAFPKAKNSTQTPSQPILIPWHPRSS